MMNIRKRLKLGTAMLLVCSVAGLGAATTVITAEPAYAKKGENSGKSSNAGGGNRGKSGEARGNSGNRGKGGEARGNSGNRGAKAAAQAERKAARAAAKAERDAAKTARAEARAAVKAEKSNKGALSSKLGALNAAHANENAFLNASPNSRVGRIAAYRELAIAAGVSGAEVDRLLEEQGFEDVDELLDYYGVESLDELVEDLDENGTPDILDDIDNRITEVGAEDYDPSADPEFPDEFVSTEDVLVDDNGTPDDPSDDTFETVTTYDVAGYQDSLSMDREDLEAGVDTAAAVDEAQTLSDDAFAALEAAGNKPVDEEVQMAVDELLGLQALIDAAIAEEEVPDEEGEGEEEEPAPSE